MCVIGVVLMLLDHSSSDAFYRLMSRSWYSAWLWPFFFFMMASTIVSSDLSNSAEIAMQYLFIFFVVVPFIAVGFSFDDPGLFFTYRLFSLYVGLNILGLITLFVFESDVLVSNTGASRYFALWDLSLMIPPLVAAFALSLLATGLVKPMSSILVAMAAVACVFFAGSRAGVLGIAIAVVGSMLVGARRRGLALRKIVILGLGLIAGGIYLSGTLLYRELAVVDRRAEFFSDAVRATSYLKPFLETVSDPRRLLVGAGLGNFQWLEQVVHNMFLQIVVEVGLLGGGCFAALVTLPLWHRWRLSATTRSALVASRLAFMSLLPFMLFHPVSTQRVYWVPYALFLSFAGVVPHRSNTMRGNPLSLVSAP